MKKYFVRMVSLAGVAFMFSAFGLVSTAPADAAGLFSRNQMPRCSMEAKMCPDGTAVTRSGPYCEFAPCKTAQPPVMCPLDAMVCPNGNVVGRVAPQCGFASCDTDTVREVPIGKVPKKSFYTPGRVVCTNNSVLSKSAYKPIRCPLPQELAL